MENKKNLMLFVVLAITILLVWENYFAPPKPVVPVTQSQNTSTNEGKAPISGDINASKLAMGGQRVLVDTGVLKVEIDTTGGDIRYVELLKHQGASDASRSVNLLSDKDGHVFVAQTGLQLANVPDALPTHKTLFSSEQLNYVMTGDTLSVKLNAPEMNGVKVTKIFEFNKAQPYQIAVKYQIVNGSDKAIEPKAYYSFLRDEKAVDGKSYFDNTYMGPAVFSQTEGKGEFQKVDFASIKKGSTDFNDHPENGWIGIIQHYFSSVWLLSPKNGDNVCAAKNTCLFQMTEENGGFYRASVWVNLPSIAVQGTHTLSLPLYVGPLDLKGTEAIAEGLVLAKDYGIFYIFATPLFWVIDQLHGLVGNWGWAIVLLTVMLKAVFFPLTAASYKSMAKMRVLAPRMATLKDTYGADRMKYQQAVMDMYKTEKVNPMGGCLPILIQIPVFMGLYWSLLASVELRGAPWVLWIQDLARPDPYYILPIIMAATMILQTYLNPPPADPMQAKMMKIMPVIFSVMFFFFPAGLVLYWVVNNILSMTQQYFINKTIEANAKAAKIDKPHAVIHAKTKNKNKS
jgi:YidC/Oxa1 family membrane protein insertase